MEELKPCPFCGESVACKKYTFGSPPDGYAICCFNPVCGMEDVGTSMMDTKEAAVAAWNCRAETTAISLLEDENNDGY